MKNVRSFVFLPHDSHQGYHAIMSILIVQKWLLKFTAYCLLLSSRQQDELLALLFVWRAVVAISAGLLFGFVPFVGWPPALGYVVLYKDALVAHL
jgi:hypothetical protein